MTSPSNPHTEIAILRIAAQVCTDKELSTLLRRLDGDLLYDIAAAEHISIRTVRNRIDNALLKIHRHNTHPKEAA